MLSRYPPVSRNIATASWCAVIAFSNRRTRGIIYEREWTTSAGK